MRRRPSVRTLPRAVFPTPVRAALEAPDHASASATSVRATGKGLSAQGYGLRPLILEVDAFLPRARVRLLEGHPEVSFAEMGGAPLAHGKHSATGVIERGRLLRDAGLVIPDDAMAGFGASGLDDVYDAAAMALLAMT